MSLFHSLHLPYHEFTGCRVFCIYFNSSKNSKLLRYVKGRENCQILLKMCDAQVYLFIYVFLIVRNKSNVVLNHVLSISGILVDKVSYLFSS